MNKYKVLSNISFAKENFAIVPIRYEDRKLIMEWRNEQMYHLRQAKFLKEKEQDTYFKETVSQLFEQEKPNQILFSYLKNDECIGYGGLVHINWLDRNAEISFIMKTALEKVEFAEHWGVFLSLIEQVAFQELELHKVFVYAFNLRPHLYRAIEANNFQKEAVLKEHCLFEGKFIDVIIHSKFAKQ